MKTRRQAFRKKWHPKKETVDDLVVLPKEKHATISQTAPLYVAYQKPIQITDKEVLSRTFEDALILANFENKYFQNKPKLQTAKTAHQDDSKLLSDSLYEYVKGLEKGDFAFDCLFHLADKETNSFNPPEYISDGLTWLKKQLLPPI